ncbi:MAG TPA: mechanosensitive ion channel domain-containing protein [Candidatus Acidoferrales bacterium]|nr:mechanosensitive ion channel domain-containing protein [Candidatus Acidoferrales bacterium]
MKTKTSQRIILFSLTLLLAAALGEWFATRDRAAKVSGRKDNVQPASDLVDLSPLQTTEHLATLAVTPEEQDLAKQALRDADLAVDLAFTAALREADAHPAPLTPETREILARVKESQARVRADQQEVARLTPLVAAAQGSRKESLQESLDIADSQLSQDQGELDDAQEDLYRAGGDERRTIERMQEEHKARYHPTAAAGQAAVSSSPAPARLSAEETAARSVLPQYLAWNSLRAKAAELLRARDAALARRAALVQRHNALEKEVKQEQSQKQQKAPKISGPGGANNPSDSNTAGHAAALSFLKHLTEDQQNLTDLDKRVEHEQEIARFCEGWRAVVAARQTHFIHGLLFDASWILLIGIFVAASNPLIHTSFSKVAPDRRRLHTLRAAIGFAVRAVAVVLILLVLFGAPNNVATIAALAGAGLTVALKDFIVGFFGWFVLMGRNGIHPGDWVEINGIGGEVVEVGLLHTVLMETGSWSDAGHPTGRKVTFVNSFAIEGHYFNFSTTGQWLWDEIQVLLPHNVDPYRIADMILKIVTDDTASNARLAEAEWQRVAPHPAEAPFSATPAMIVRPTNLGVNVTVRYISRAHERHETRSRLYRSIVELLHRKKIPESAAGGAGPKTAAAKS